jgi:hypothetical protein
MLASNRSKDPTGSGRTKRKDFVQVRENRKINKQKREREREREREGK